LTARLGLNRSTIRTLVTDLSERGVLCELAPVGNHRAGRPSRLVGPRSDGPYAIAVDVDVERIMTAAVGLTGQMLNWCETGLREDERTAERVTGVIVTHVDSLIRRALPGAWPVGVGVCVPGTVTGDGSDIVLAPNLGWRDLPFASMVADALLDGVSLKLPVQLGNDADLGVLAEHVRGAARGCDDVVYLAGRAGVGAGVLINGVPLRGRGGFAGEIGHLVLDPNGPLCHCGNRGCAETYIGQQAVLAAVGHPRPSAWDSARWLGPDGEAGDLNVVARVGAIAEPLGRVIAALVTLLNPQRVLLGGVLAGVLDVARTEVEASVRRHAFGASRGCAQLCCAGLGGDSSLLGAAEIAFRALLANPTGRP
jgi:predicted NBD/HSP70 family sugar kinase